MTIKFGEVSAISRRMGSPGLTFGTTQETFGGGQPIWEDIMKRYTHGIRFTDEIADGEIIPDGCPLGYNKVEKTAQIHRSFVVHEVVGAAATTIKVVKNSIYPRIFAGDVIMVPPAVKGGTGLAVTVDTIDDDTNDDFTEVTVSATLGALAEGAILSEADAAGAAGKVLVEVNTFLDQSVRVGDGDSNSNADTVIIASPVWSGEINADLIPPYPAYVENDEVLGQRILFNRRKA